MKRIFILLMFSMIGSWLLAQAPQRFNYQAVARDSAGNPLTNQNIDLRFSIHQGGTGGLVVYQEEFLSLTTNSYGLFDLQIGDGTPVQGSFSGINWGANAFFLEVELRLGSNSFTSLGASQIVSVAYALFAKDVLNKDDADADPANELQSLGLNGDTLSISNGNSVIFDDKVFDGDSSALNEIQVLSIAGDTLSLSNGGMAVILPDDQDWMQSGNAVYNMTDSVGIGTNQPQAALDVVGSLRFADGNQAAGRVLVSDSTGVARWDSLGNPFTFYATNPNWSVTGPGAAENIYCTVTITLTKRSLVAVNAYGHVFSNPSTVAIVGIVFPGETLNATSPNVLYDLKQAQAASVGTAFGHWGAVATSRAKILNPGTHQISLRFNRTINNGSVTMHGGSLAGYVIPFH